MLYNSQVVQVFVPQLVSTKRRDGYFSQSSGHGKRSPHSGILLAAFGYAAIVRWGCRDEEVRLAREEPWRSPQSSLRDYGFLLERLQEEHSWSAAHAAGAISEYLRFMQLLAEAPKMELIASSDIDLVWHEHILDSANYCKL